jgi:hypothetical protein
MTKLTLAAAAVILGTTVAGSAMAVPVAKIDTDKQQSIQNVRYVCGPHRCWWRPNYYGHYLHHYYAYYPRWHRYRHWY